MYISETNRTIYNGQLPLSDEYNISNLSIAILSILHKSLPAMVQNRLPLFNFFAYSNNSEHLQYFKDVIDETLENLTKNMSVRVGLNIPVYSDRERHDAVLFVDSSEAMNFLYKEFLRLHIRGNNFYLIVLHTFRTYYYDELLEIVNINWSLGISHFAILIYALWNSVLVYTIFPYNQHHCEGTAPVLQNRFDGKKWQYENEPFFPYRVGNLYGCDLRCVTWEQMPYLKKLPTEFMGIEGRLLNYFKKSLNFNFKIRYLTQEEIQRTLIDENDLFHELFSNGTDFVVGGFRYKPITSDSPFLSTNPYFFSHLYLLVNANREPYSPVAKLFFPLSYNIWFILFIMFFIGFLVSEIVVRRKYCIRSLIIGAHNRTPFYNMFVVWLGGNIVGSPRRNFARFLLIMWLFTALVIRCSYQAFMFHFIRTDISKPPPNTIREVLDQNYKIYMSESSYIDIQNLTDIIAVSNYFNGTEEENFYRLNNSSEKIAILTPLECYNHYKKYLKEKPNFHLVKEKLLTQQLSIYMRKNTVMLRRFNMGIQNYLYFGMNQKVLNILNQNPLEKINQRQNDETEAKKMGLNELKGIFGLFIIGHFINSFIFIMEIVIFKMKRLWA